jgi:anti-sigma-K factor RskA
MPEATHPEFHPDLGGYVLGVLEPDEAEAFEAHLVTCAQCRTEVAELSALPGLLEQAAPPVEVPPDLRERIFAAIKREASGPAAPQPRRAKARKPRRVVELRRVAAVAAAIVLLGAALTVVRQVASPEPAVAEVVLRSPTGGPARGTAEIRETDEGQRIDLEVADLPPTPPGYYYECWLVGPGDTLEKPNRVSVGTFTVDADGRAKVRWNFAVDLARFPRMGVTLEPDDGNPAQTPDRVLAATRPL